MKQRARHSLQASQRALVWILTGWVCVNIPALATAAESRIEPITAAEFGELLTAKRGKVVLVNFWATWCRPCLKEIPELEELAARYRERGFELVAVSLDEPEDLEAVVIPFLDKWFPEFRSYARLERSMDSVVSVVDRAWNEVLPTSYVLSADGQVKAMLQGGKSGAEFEAAILPLLP
jgi:thiol-disulfide isomerase/thioredoxin